MKTFSFFKIAIVAIPFALASCGSSKKLATTTTTPPISSEKLLEKEQVLKKVTDNSQTAKFITSKIKFQVQVGSQNLTLTGNLKMKRDEVIRLQLMAFGFVEAGRLEFTKDYVLIMDRINKQYIKASYGHLDFLRNSGLNFYSLQALFWNELFEPGQTKVSAENLATKFETYTEGEDVIISLSHDKMSYKWLASQTNGNIRMANILYTDKFRGNTQLNWDYTDFEELGNKQFPKGNAITFTMPTKEVKLSMNLNYIGNDSEWETHTDVSSKYREVTVDEILRRFMAL